MKREKKTSPLKGIFRKESCKDQNRNCKKKRCLKSLSFKVKDNEKGILKSVELYNLNEDDLWVLIDFEPGGKKFERKEFQNKSRFENFKEGFRAFKVAVKNWL